MSSFDRFPIAASSKREAIPAQPTNIIDLIRAVREQPIPKIPAGEVAFETMRAGGKGGQNVNKVESAVRVLWDPLQSRVLTPEQCEYLVRASEVVQKMNTSGQVAIRCDSEQAQPKNKRIALERLNELVASVLTIQAPRETEMKKEVKNRMNAARIADKKRGSERRAGRNISGSDW